MALSSENKAKWAEELYVNSDLNQVDICEIVEISDKTLRDWRDKYGWEELKKASKITTPQLIAKLNGLLFIEVNKTPPDENVIAQLSFDLEIEQLQPQPSTDEVKRLKGAILREKLKSGPDADKIVKFTKSIEYLKNKELVISDYVKMFRKFTEWLFIRNAEAAKMLNNYMKDFVNFIIHGRD